MIFNMYCTCTVLHIVLLCTCTVHVHMHYMYMYCPVFGMLYLVTDFSGNVHFRRNVKLNIIIEHL